MSPALVQELTHALVGYATSREPKENDALIAISQDNCVKSPLGKLSEIKTLSIMTSEGPGGPEKLVCMKTQPGLVPAIPNQMITQHLL